MEIVAETSKFMNTEELADYLRVSGDTLDRLRNRLENPIPHIRVSERRVIFNKASVEEWVMEQEIR